MHMNPNLQGRVTELKVLQYVMERGYSISLPFDDKERYDQVWDINGKLFRVQIKTARSIGNNEGIMFNCYSVCNGHKRRYTKQEVDLFATFWDDKLYIVPVEECSIEKTLRFLSPKNNHSNISFANNYLFEEVIQRL